MFPIQDAAMTTWVAVALGLLLLFFGRKLFWVFVGVFGFLAGVQIAGRFAQGQSELVLLLIALGLGALGALLAIVLQRIAVAVAGWIAGAYLALRLAAIIGWESESTLWILFVIGAVIAAIVVSLLFDWALIGLSALTDAILVADALPWGQTVAFVVGAILFVLGALAQARMLSGAPPRPQPARANSP